MANAVTTRGRLLVLRAVKATSFGAPRRTRPKSMRSGSMSSRLTTPLPESTTGSALQVGQGVTWRVACAGPRRPGVKSTWTEMDCSDASVMVPCWERWNAAASAPVGGSMRTSVRACPSLLVIVKLSETVLPSTTSPKSSDWTESCARPRTEFPRTSTSCLVGLAGVPSWNRSERIPSALGWNRIRTVVASPARNVSGSPSTSKSGICGAPGIDCTVVVRTPSLRTTTSPSSSRPSATSPKSYDPGSTAMASVTCRTSCFPPFPQPANQRTTHAPTQRRTMHDLRTRRGDVHAPCQGSRESGPAPRLLARVDERSRIRREHDTARPGPRVEGDLVHARSGHDDPVGNPLPSPAHEAERPLRATDPDASVRIRSERPDVVRAAPSGDLVAPPVGPVLQLAPRARRREGPLHRDSRHAVHIGGDPEIAPV